jgi:hypothetical protein
MKDAMILLFHLLAVIAGLLRPGGGRTIVAVCLSCLWQLELAIRHGQALPECAQAGGVVQNQPVYAAIGLTEPVSDHPAFSCCLYSGQF